MDDPPSRVIPELRKEWYNAKEARHLELMKATIAFEHAVLRPAFLLNGGASVAALTFLGNVKAAPDWPILCAVGSWALGVTLASFSAAAGYQAQHRYLKRFRRLSEAEEIKMGVYTQDEAMARPSRIEKKEQEAKEHEAKAEWHQRLWKWLFIFSYAMFGAGSVFALFFIAFLRMHPGVPEPLYVPL